MFSGGFTEVGFILFIAFLLFGPKKLPEIARILGKGMGELRRASNELKNSLEEEIRNLDRKDDEVSYSGHEYSEHEDSGNESSDHEYSDHDYAGHDYTEHETHPYTETEEEGFEHPEEPHELSAESEQATLSDHPEQTEEKLLSDHSEGDLEPAPEYGYDYSESPQQEPEPRPRG